PPDPAGVRPHRRPRPDPHPRRRLHLRPGTAGLLAAGHLPLPAQPLRPHRPPGPGLRPGPGGTGNSPAPGRGAGSGWLFFLVSSVCLAISACYEFVEWGAAVAFGQGAEEFLATQGDPWDTQSDMA